MSYSPAQAVANARADVGYREGRNNYNKYTPWQTNGRYNYCAYCASGTSKWTCDAGFVYTEPEFPGANPFCLWGANGDWNVGAQHEWALRQGLWRNVNNYRVQPGDLVVFNFGLDDQHVGLGIGDSGGNIASIDANTTPGGVFFKSRPRFQVEGAIALTQSHQATGASITPQEIVQTDSPTPYLDLEDDDMVIVVSDNKPAMLISGGKACLIRDGQTVLRLAEAKVGVANHITAHDYNSFLEAFNAHR